MTIPRTLVTGHTGFVGGHFLVLVGAENVVSWPSTIDLVNFDQVRKFVLSQKFDAVLHLAARSSVAESFEDPRKTHDVNVRGTEHLLRALVEAQFTGSVLLVSSGEVYGAVDEKDLPVAETASLAPRNPYAESKVAMEALVKTGGEFAESLFRTMIARPFNHIGPGQAPRFAVSSFAHQLARRKAGLEQGVMKTGDLGVTRDFTDVRDIVTAYSQILVHGRRGEVYNLGSGRETKLQTILETLIDISGTGAEFEVDPSRLRPGEQRRMCADVSKIRRDIGWQPTRSLKSTLTDCFNSAFENLKTKNSERTST